jgi:predicted porin
MKKTLVAIAALAATGAFAQSSVTLSGNLDVGYQAIDAKGNKFTNSSGSNGSSTTAIFFRGTEELGGGMKAGFQYEIDPSFADTSSRTVGTSATGTTSNVTSSIGNGASFLELSGNFGAIKLGTPNSTTLAANGDGNSGFATAIGSGYRVTSFDAVRFQNSLRYDTPSFAGFSAGFLQSAKNTKQSLPLNLGQTGNLQNQTNGRDQVTEISAAYVQGPLTVRAANLTVQQWADVALVGTGVNQFSTATWSATDGKEFKLNTLSAKYQVNNDLSVAYFYQTAKSDTLVGSKADGTATTNKFDRTTNGVSAAFQATPTIKLMANYAKADNGAAAVSSGATTSANKSTKVLGLGLDYSLSKRTTAYVRYEKDSDAAGFRSITGYTAATGNTTYTATAAGIRHTF